MTDIDETPEREAEMALTPVCRKPMESIILDEEIDAGDVFRGLFYGVLYAAAAWIVIAAWLALSEK